MSYELREQAKQLKQAKNYIDAVTIYASIWDDNCDDRWLSWEYAYCLKYSGNIDKAIYVCKNTYKIDKEFVANNNLMSWCVYEKYFAKKEGRITLHSIEKLCQIAETLTDIIEQNENTPYIKIIFSIIDRLKDRNNDKSNTEILKWLGKLDESKLSANTYAFINDNGRQVEVQSPIEEYYSNKTKALYNLKKYDECVSCCNKAMKAIDKFHYDNDIWIEARKIHSMGMLSDSRSVIPEMEKLIRRRPHSSLYNKIAQIYWKLDDKKSALVNMYKAMLTPEEEKMKINIIYRLAEMLEEIGDASNAAIHYKYYGKIKELNGWHTSNLVNLNIEKYSDNKIDETQLEKRSMKLLWLSEVKKNLTQYSGKVMKILPSNKAGFIQYGDKTIYFRANSILFNRRVKEKDMVTFCIAPSYNKVKDEETLEAIYIEIMQDIKK